MSLVDVDAVMAGLKGFQRAAVDHVFDRFYGDEAAGASGRFLIADETGLGKSIVARGVVARSIEELERRGVPRIDVVYICSNQDLARQNLQRINVTGERQLEMTTRLSLLAKHSRHLDDGAAAGRSTVNLVSFTPGTSFSGGGWRQGNAEERAMLAILIASITSPTPAQRRAMHVLLRGTVRDAAYFGDVYVDRLRRELGGEPDEVIAAAFRSETERSGALERFLALRDEMRGRTRIPDAIWHRVQDSIAELRQTLAKCGVDRLEPDLVILDEFQRFRHLLDPSSGDAGELADALFRFEDVKVLLLSATPYKPFTTADDADDDHSRDFLATVRFLAGGNEGDEAPVAGALERYRTTLTTGGDAAAAAADVRAHLLPLMTRSERPALGERDDLVQVRHLDSHDPTVADIRDWVALRYLGEEVESPIDLEYWKSVPYFANFMDGYQPAVRFKDARAAALASEEIVADAASTGRAAFSAMATALAATRSLDREALLRFDPVDLGNSHTRALADATVGRGWWKLLWVPPTMPYVEPGPIYAPLSDGSVTKQVVFSAWSAVPGAVAGLLSYEADRHAAGDRALFRENSAEGRRAVAARRLAYRLVDGEKPGAMSTLALFWPHPALAALGDQLDAARERGGRVTADVAVARVSALLPAVADVGQGADAVFRYPGALPASLAGASAGSLVHEMLDDEAAEESADAAATRGSKGLTAHVEAALAAVREAPSSAADALGHPDLARLAVFAPGNAAYGAIRSVAGAGATEAGVWSAAFRLADGVRSLFNRPESIALLATLYGDGGDDGAGEAQWRRVLDYCADGNLRAVLDEYVFQLRSELGGGELGDDELLQLAGRAADAIRLRPARYVAHDTTPERGTIPLIGRFALRYGGRTEVVTEASDGVRQGEVRASFNSPFAPFVLASTSVGQEGMGVRNESVTTDR